METNVFITNYREAFGEKAELPLVFWYSEKPATDTIKIGGCLFKCMKEVRAGSVASLNAETIGCGGGKFYTGFTEMPDRIPNFVSLKEKYKQTPELVTEQIEALGVPRAEKAYINFARIDRIESFDNIEAILFLATPDMLSGLTTWAYFDNNADDTVTAPFGSGCSNTITRAVLENRKNGKSCIIGFFDPSVRPFFESNLLSFTIPLSRFREMYHTMRNCCLFDTHAWGKIKDRINE